MKYRSVHVSFVSKRLNRSSRSQITPCNSGQSYKNINNDLTLRSNSWIISSQSPKTQSPIDTRIGSTKSDIRNSKRPLSTPVFSCNISERFAKKTFSDVRTENIEKKNKYSKKCRIAIIIIIILVILIVLGVMIYLIIYFTTKTTTTRTPIGASLRWNLNGITVAGISGSYGAASNQLYRPVDVKLYLSDTLYIADNKNHRIQKWSISQSNGVTVAGATYGNNTIDLFNPSGIYIDPNRNIYIADTKNHRIQYWTNGASSGTTLLGTGVAGSTTTNELNQPYAVVRDENTKILYIADFNNHRIISLSSGASNGTLALGGQGSGLNNTQLNRPIGLHFDSISNSLYIANSGGHNIVRWVLGTNSWILVAGETGLIGNTSTTLCYPSGVTLDPMGNLYVADSGNHRIQLFLPGQTKGITIAGIGLSGSNSTALNTPFTLILDNQLNLYIADSENNRIQKFVRY